MAIETCAAEFAYSSEVIAALLRRAAKVAKSDISVLIQGETGTGKEALARFIHRTSGAARPFVVIDCSGLPEHLIDSELFGYVRGAFTGAVSDKVGLLALANGGTAFFDEIGELPGPQQAKLLRVLQEREIRPVGGTRANRLQFRIIAATNRRLREEVQAGRFREDLFYRLSAVRLDVPPLRERREDISMLAQLFAKRRDPAFQIPATVLSKLASLPWPGNVRQLENCIGCMVALQECPLLGTASQCDLLGHTDTAESTTQMSNAPEGDLTCLSLAQLQRKAVATAMTRSGGDRSRAATLLGIGRTTLYRRLKEYSSAVAIG